MNHTMCMLPEAVGRAIHFIQPYSKDKSRESNDWTFERQDKHLSDQGKCDTTRKHTGQSQN